ncbi:MAG: DUF4921 family protein [Candidatus Colwellbacteria bacterium]|nr:DUF4921 family protein [Candidatus Colwellbacteria bacterium]
MNPELRQDLVSGDWILIAPGRHRRVQQFKETGKRLIPSKKDCPLENWEEKNNREAILKHPKGKNWRIQVIPNIYPAVMPSPSGSRSPKIKKRGPFATLPAFGYHEVIVTRDHLNNFPRLKPSEAALVFQTFKERYLAISRDQKLTYISIFQNWGAKAGSSIYHPHYQLLAIPVLPPDIARSLEGSQNYFRKHKACVHCIQIAWEKKEKKRVVYETKNAIAFLPFVGREPFEMRVFPKSHSPFFEESTDGLLRAVAEVLSKSLKKLERSLKLPDYNFYIHTAPLRNRNRYHQYHWHVEIIPRTTISAGFELGSGIEINPVDPDEAALLLAKN